jgi:agmatine deiminase
MKKCLPPLIVIAAILLLTAGPVHAQQTSPAQTGQSQSPGHDNSLTIGLTTQERSLLHLIGMTHRATSPPTGPVRAAAEWDESRGVFCLWDNAELMDELQKDNDLYIITTSGSKSWWQSWLSSRGIPQTNVKWLIASTNTFWVRDYGPWFIWDGNNDFGLVDNIYNRPRPLDDQIPGVVASTYNIPLYGTTLEHTGGNYYADGYGNAWSSTLVYSENPGMTQAQVDAVMSDYLGIDRYVTRDLKEDIEHFDTFGKLLAPDLLLWSDFPDDKDHSSWSEAALRYYRTLASPYDTPYRIHRMPLWTQSFSMTAYINSLMTQDKIILPDYNISHDTEAVNRYSAAAPGYNVVTVANGGTYWGDSVHCRTRNFHRGDGVRIYAYPPRNTEETVNPTVVRAEIYTDNATSLNGNPKIYWTTTGGAPFSTVGMVSTGTPDEYTGGIPGQTSGTTVSFYVFAEDMLGSTRTHPPVAPGDLHSYLVETDTTPPELDHDPIGGVAVADWPPVFRARATDNTCVPAVTLDYSINGQSKAPVTMTRVPGTFLFEGTPTASASTGDLVTYRITATDTAAAANTTMTPTEVGHFFKITAHNAVCVIELDQTPWSGDRWVEMCADFGLAWDYTTAWPASLSGYDAVIICLGMSPSRTQLTTSQANALTSFLTAGGSAYMEGGNCFAQDSARAIYRSHFGVASASSGSTLTGTITGASGTPFAAMAFTYAGDTRSSDHLNKVSSATNAVYNGSYVKSVLYDTGTYSTVGTSFEFAGLEDGANPSRAKKMAALYLDHLGLDIDLVAHGDAILGGTVNLDMTGSVGQKYFAALSYKPAYQSAGAAGVYLIDPNAMVLIHSGNFPASGTISLPLNVPNNPALLGREVFFQGMIVPAGPGSGFLTNRDRVVIE